MFWISNLFLNLVEMTRYEEHLDASLQKNIFADI